MKSLIKKSFLKFGYLLCKIPSNYRLNNNSFDDVLAEYNKRNLKFTSIKDSLADYEVVKENTMVPFDNLASLYEQVQYLESNDIEGDFVECGVWKGGATGLTALANLRYSNKRRHIHMFDAFQDICEPDPEKDGFRAIEEAKKYANVDLGTNTKGSINPMTGFYDFLGGHGTIEVCKELLLEKIKYPEEFIHIYPGWFQETFTIYAPNIHKIALLRLDSDWYESTKLSLEFFYDKVVEGGIIVIDDYGTYEGCKKAVDDFFANRHLKKFLINASPLNSECYFIVK